MEKYSLHKINFYLSIFQKFQLFLFLPQIIIALSLLNTTQLFSQLIVGSITRSNLNPGSLAVYEAGNKLFVGDWETGNLLIYDGTSLDLLSELQIDGGCGGSCMVVHEGTGKIYLGTFPYGRHIAEINAETNELIGYIEIDGQCVSIDEDLGKVYTIRRYAPFILYSIDVYTNHVDSVTLSNSGLTSGMGINPMTHEVFIGYLQGNSLDIVDGMTLALTTIPGINGRGIIVNWLENKVYGEIGTFDGFWVYDRDIDSMKVYKTYNDANPEIFNPTSNRVHTGSEVNGESTIIECASDSWSNIPMYSATVELGVRYTTNHVYYVGFSNIVVLDGSSLERLLDRPSAAVIDKRGQDIVLNQSTGRVFMSFSSYSEDGKVLVMQDLDDPYIPYIGVYPDTLCFGIIENQKSSIYTDSLSTYNYYYVQELLDTDHHNKKEAKKIVRESYKVLAEQTHSLNSHCLKGKGIIVTLMYDDGIPEYFWPWSNGARYASRMSPNGSCKILEIQVYCNTAQNYKLGIYDWTGSAPGSGIFETGMVSSLGQGWNKTDISSYNIKVNGDFIASFNMIDSVASLGVDLFDNNRAWDYNGLSWNTYQAATYFIRTKVEYENGIIDTVGTMTIKNFGNRDLVVNDITTSQDWITSIEPHSVTVAPNGSEAISITVSTLGLSNGTYYGSLDIFSNDTNENPYIEPVKFIVPILGIENELQDLKIPKMYYLSQNYPNPFNPLTKITFTLPKPEHVTLEVFNTLGQQVIKLLDKKITAGSHEVQFDSFNLSSGIYFYQIQAGKFSQVRKMVLLR